MVLGLLHDLLDLLLHPVEGLGVGLAALLGRTLLELKRRVDIGGQRDQGAKELRRREGGRAGQGSEGRALEQAEDLVEL